MQNEDIEFLISQHADGALDAAAAADLQAILSNEPALRERLAEYRRVTAALREHSALPLVNWDRLAAEISARIDAAEASSAQARSRMFIGRWVAVAGGLAACAAVALLLRRPVAEPPSGAPMARVLQVDVGSQETASAAAKVEISIGAPEGSVASALAFNTDLFALSSSRILVSAGDLPTSPDALSGQ